MSTDMYVKMDACDQLLLSEGVCHQLGIITYHPDVRPWKNCKDKRVMEPSDDQSEANETMSEEDVKTQDARVPQVRLLQTVRVLPQHTKNMKV